MILSTGRKRVSIYSRLVAICPVYQFGVAIAIGSEDAVCIAGQKGESCEGGRQGRGSMHRDSRVLDPLDGSTGNDEDAWIVNSLCMCV